MDALVKKAYENWMHVIEYDSKSLLGSKEDDSAGPSQANVPMDPQGYPISINQQHTLPTLSVPVPSEQSPIDSSLNVGGNKIFTFYMLSAFQLLRLLYIKFVLTVLFVSLGYDDSMAARMSMQSQNVHLHAQNQFNGSSFTLQNPLVSGPHQVQVPGLNNEPALGPCQSSMPGFHEGGTSHIPTYKGIDDFFSEEEIKMRSNEMLDNEDMQHLLRIFNMGSHCHATPPPPPPFNAIEDTHPYPSTYMPTPSLPYGFDNDASCSSGKAVVGWLKLKAALRWGIFIRKKAAERRAHLIELDDS